MGDGWVTDENPICHAQVFDMQGKVTEVTEVTDVPRLRMTRPRVLATKGAETSDPSPPQAKPLNTHEKRCDGCVTADPSRALPLLAQHLEDAERLVRHRRTHRDPTDPIGSACLISEAEGR
ncbi:MAG: hypothetical protein GVY33_02055, partial [Alphaproteobacteria bacterium]|nr:hypothetical protein [Alphaproteobacteria bacterium]